MKEIILFISILAMAICSCNKRDDLQSFLKGDVKEYNDKISNGMAIGEDWAKDPILIVNKLFRSSDLERKLTIDLELNSVDNLLVILTQEGLDDDSVEGEKRIIEFIKVDDHWYIKSLKLGFKCWEFRGGHTNYSGNICS